MNVVNSPPAPQDIIEDQVHSRTKQLDKESKALGGNNSYPPAIVNIFFFYFCNILKMKRSFLEHLRNIFDMGELKARKISLRLSEFLNCTMYLLALFGLKIDLLLNEKCMCVCVCALGVKLSQE